MVPRFISTNYIYEQLFLWTLLTYSKGQETDLPMEIGILTQLRSGGYQIDKMQPRQSCPEPSNIKLLTYFIHCVQFSIYLNKHEASWLPLKQQFKIIYIYSCGIVVFKKCILVLSCIFSYLILVHKFCFFGYIFVDSVCCIQKH